MGKKIEINLAEHLDVKNVMEQITCELQMAKTLANVLPRIRKCSDTFGTSQRSFYSLVFIRPYAGRI